MAGARGSRPDWVTEGKAPAEAVGLSLLYQGDSLRSPRAAGPALLFSAPL